MNLNFKNCPIEHPIKYYVKKEFIELKINEKKYFSKIKEKFDDDEININVNTIYNTNTNQIKLYLTPTTFFIKKIGKIQKLKTILLKLKFFKNKNEISTKIKKIKNSKEIILKKKENEFFLILILIYQKPIFKPNFIMFSNLFNKVLIKKILVNVEKDKFKEDKNKEKLIKENKIKIKEDIKENKIKEDVKKNENKNKIKEDIKENKIKIKEDINKKIKNKNLINKENKNKIKDVKKNIFKFRYLQKEKKYYVPIQKQKIKNLNKVKLKN
jgi:hypothetical protein